MKYKDIIQKAKKDGIASENAMWAGVNHVDDILEILKDDYPETYWQFLRDTHTDLYGKHYDESFARYDVGKLRYTNKDNTHCEGGRWTPEEVKAATGNIGFPQGTTSWDVYVACNVMYADLCKGFADQDIIKAAYLFFFADEDYEGCGKIWDYMNAMRG